jgi:hypothetical protein
MKRYLIFLGFLLMIAFIACEKDKKTGGDETDPAFNAPFSDNTVGQNKQNLEQTGVDMMDEVTQLEDVQAIEIIIEFINLMDSTYEEEEEQEARQLLEPLEMVASIKTGDAGPEDVLREIKSTAEDPVSLSEEWENIAARYTWNSDNGNWDSTGSEGALIFEFPGLEGDITNTAVLTVSNVNFYEIPDPMDFWPSEDVEPELPTSLQVDLKYNGNTVSSFNFSAAYTTSGLPTSINATLSVDEFSFVLTLTHNPYTNASATASFKRNNNVLIELHVEGNGDWSNENIENNTVTHYDTIYIWDWDPELGWYETDEIDWIDEWDKVEAEEIIHSANAHLVVMNIKMAGMVNIKQLADIIKELEEDEELEDEEAADQLADAINTHAALVVVYKDTNEKIADLEFYKAYWEDEYEDDYYIDVRFIFADGSKVDAETYFEDGFDDLVDALNDFITELNEDYDAGIDLIEDY